jgi:hypothetical protein
MLRITHSEARGLLSRHGYHLAHKQPVRAAVCKFILKHSYS